MAWTAGCWPCCSAGTQTACCKLQSPTDPLIYDQFCDVSQWCGFLVSDYTYSGSPTIACLNTSLQTSGLYGLGSGALISSPWQVGSRQSYPGDSGGTAYKWTGSVSFTCPNQCNIFVSGTEDTVSINTTIICDGLRWPDLGLMFNFDWTTVCDNLANPCSGGCANVYYSGSHLRGYVQTASGGLSAQSQQYGLPWTSPYSQWPGEVQASFVFAGNGSVSYQSMQVQSGGDYLSLQNGTDTLQTQITQCQVGGGQVFAMHSPTSRGVCCGERNVQRH